MANASHLFLPVPVKKILFYRQKQPIYEEWDKAGLLDEMTEGMPERNDLLTRLSEYKDKGGCIIFFDDMSSLVQNYEEDFVHYWTIASHHYNVSFFLVLHSLFSPALRMLSLNTHRFFLTKSPRDVSQVRTLASQAFPGRSSFVVDAYEDATDRRYGFLILDFSPNCDSRLRVVANIFGPDPPSVYQYKEVSRTKMVKMENKFRKQALIPWPDFLRLRSKAEANNVTRPNTSCGQPPSCQPVIQQCEKPIVYDVRPPVAPLPVSTEESYDGGKSGDHPSKVEILAPEPNVTSSESPSEPGPVSSPPPTQIPSAPPPVIHSIIPTPVPTKTIVVKSPGQPKRSLMKKKGGKKADKGIIPYDDNMEISVPHHPTDLPSSNPNTLATLVPFSPVSQSSPSMSLPAAINPPSAPPTDMLPITYSPSPTATYPHLPNAIHHIPAPPTNLPALTYSPSLPTTSQRKKKKQEKVTQKIDQPPRARENLEQKPQDSAYPKSLHRDQDIEPNPLSFPSKIKEKKRQNVKPKLFLPSPPYASAQIKKRPVKRKNAFSKPRPTLAAKQPKYNRGEKRKFKGTDMGSKKYQKVRSSTSQRTESLADTDFDIW